MMTLRHLSLTLLITAALSALTVKSGRCPVMDQGCPEGQIDPVKCFEDFDCPDNLKCCSTGCGGSVCVVPETVVNPGQCPVAQSPCEPGAQKEDLCSDDGDCTLFQKCCFQCLGKRCVTPVVASLGGVVEGACTEVLVGNCSEPFVKIIQGFLLKLPSTNAELRRLCWAESEVYSCLTRYNCDVSSVQDDHKKTMKACNDRFSVKPGLCKDFTGILADCAEGSFNATADCDTDYNCTGNMKCCPQLCVKPLCKPPLKSGRCPARTQACPEGQTDPVECSEDFDCPDNLRCCSTGCGGRVCVVPETVVNEGQCPAAQSPCEPGAQKEDLCSDDGDCTFLQKCCSQCLGKRCVTAEHYIDNPPPPPPPEEKPGECIVSKRACLDTTNIPKDECRVDSDCKGDLKCCRAPCGNMVCSEPYLPPPPKEKPGECMVSERPCLDTTNIPKDECRVDGDCKGDFKCCLAPCGNMICSEPYLPPPPKEKPGVCILSKRACSDTTNIPKDECSVDIDCKGNLKCCRAPCGNMVCSQPSRPSPAVRPGSCPQVTVRCREPTPADGANRCGTDMACRGNQKCCPSPCPGFGSSCVDPVL